jgi:hypothetical protein
MSNDNGTHYSELALLTKIGYELDKATKFGPDVIGEAMDIRRDMVMPEKVRTQNGIVLALRKVPGSLVSEAIRKLKAPSPPVFHDEERNRDFTNEQDPQYLTDLTEWHWNRVVVSNLAYLGLGTSLVSTPSNVLGPDDPWDKEIEDLGIELDIPPVGTKKRYVAWLLNYALDNEEKQTVVDLVIGNYGEVREEAVAAAMDNFRRAIAGPTNNDTESTTIQS